MDDNIIVMATVGKMPEKITDPSPEVTATFGNGTTKKLFTFFPDEISFNPEEFVGLTEQEARDLYHRKDVEYLKS